MATVTKPMALDESIHTTDGNDTNIADLMQSGLASIATAIGAIPALDAANITYNNSTSGLSASHVGTAIDELASEKADSATTLAGYGITDAYTKTETGAKLAALDYSDTAVSGSYVTEVDETDGVISVTREAADASPTSSSSKMVTSGGVYTALSAKQDTLTAGTGIDITGNTISVDATASEITFDDTNAGLGVSNTQDAIDALNTDLTTLNTTVTSLSKKGILNYFSFWQSYTYSKIAVDFSAAYQTIFILGQKGILCVCNDMNGSQPESTINGSISIDSYSAKQIIFNLSTYTRIYVFSTDSFTITGVE